MPQESEFSVSINISRQKIPPQGVMVVWEWEWTSIDGDAESNQQSESEEDSQEQYNPHMQSDTEHSDSDCENVPDTLPTMTHTVTFKCIGSVHDVNKQLVLSNVHSEPVGREE